MVEVSTIVGIAFMAVGGILVSIGLFLCYSTKGEYYNQDEVQAMVTAEVLEEEKKKTETDLETAADKAAQDSAVNSSGPKKKGRRAGPMVAA